MKSKWRVMKNPMLEKPYVVYRLKDISMPMTRSNMEVLGNSLHNRSAAEIGAEVLNSMEREGEL